MEDNNNNNAGQPNRIMVNLIRQSIPGGQSSIVIPKLMVERCKWSLVGAHIVCELVYHSAGSSDWFPRSRWEWEMHSMVRADDIKAWEKRLKGYGWLTVKRRRGSFGITNHYRIDWVRFMQWFTDGGLDE